ncbi:hypothetical protein HZH68_013425 [Vespula germanica]|uniref:Uncharacterized protein n=1 Tax=Vespula germanica TaxID=30212 RepID=A0A834JCU4_VESGE|nr:hypothetical protein HZH68_013425 [Vespula germanica]
MEEAGTGLSNFLIRENRLEITVALKGTILRAAESEEKVQRDGGGDDGGGGGDAATTAAAATAATATATATAGAGAGAGAGGAGGGRSPGSPALSNSAAHLVPSRFSARILIAKMKRRRDDRTSLEIVLGI